LQRGNPDGCASWGCPRDGTRRASTLDSLTTPDDTLRQTRRHTAHRQAHPKTHPTGTTRRGANERRRPVQPLGDSLSRDADSEPTSRPSPTDPALRANPCSEVTDPICRLPLPTLFYRPEAVHLGDLLRMWVRPGTRITCLSLGFSRADGGAPDAARTAALFGVDGPYLRASRFQAPWPLTKKRELFPGPPPASPSSFASPQWPRPDARPLRPREWTRAPGPGDRRSPCSGSGILTRFPFEEA
jgi:hypothetical protein